MPGTVLSCAHGKASDFADFMRRRYSAAIVAEYAVVENNGGVAQKAVWQLQRLTEDELNVIRSYTNPAGLPAGPLRGLLMALALQLQEHPTAAGRPDFAEAVAAEMGLRARAGRVTP